MAREVERGVVVDKDGFFVAALQWETGTPAPKLNEKVTKGKSAELVLLRDPYAIENVEANARWDFTPVREDGVLIRAGTWQFPTEKRWIVTQRRDIPDLWFYTGAKAVWPDRLPRVGSDQQFIDIAPPDVGRSARPLWDDSAQAWLKPKSKLVLDADGVVENVIVTYREDDIPSGATRLLPAEDHPGVGIGWRYDGAAFAPPAPTVEQVNAERDRRLVGDFEFQGVMFQRDERSLARITGAATLAGFALAAGARPGDLRWANPDRDFVWIASDNSLVSMDAETALAFGQAAAGVETSIIFVAKQLREMDPIPNDYTDDKWWP